MLVDGSLKIQIKHLLNKVNRVTSNFRHGVRIPDRDMAELSNVHEEFAKSFEKVEVIKDQNVLLRYDREDGVLIIGNETDTLDVGRFSIDTESGVDTIRLSRQSTLKVIQKLTTLLLEK